MIDLRSDTVTKPTDAMRRAISTAEVGDDYLGEDPTAQALEAETARITGKEAALFVSSGTMGNQLAIALQTQRGDEVIVGEGAHVVFYEAGAGASLSGVQFTIAGAGGMFGVADLEACIQPPGPYWSARTSLVCVENTHNRAGGRIFAQQAIVEIAAAAKKRGLSVHLDGARIWNAAIATGLSVETLCKPADTVSVCFSKGLGAPVGSALCGSRDQIERARRLRKMWGGAMRQSGILAAGALYALQHHRERLADDHANAKLLATKLGAEAETNIVNIDTKGPADVVARRAKEEGVLLNASGHRRLRAVTHLDVSREQVARAAEILAKVIAE